MSNRAPSSPLAVFKASVRDLQRILGKGEPPARMSPTKSFNWLRRHSWTVVRVEHLTPGASVVLTLRDGRAFVGDVEHNGGSWVTLLLWGVHGPAVEFEATAVERCTLVGQHPWSEECEVRKRQGAGLPAVIVVKTDEGKKQMSSGNKRMIINTRERAISNDHNRAQAFNRRQ